MFKFLKKKESVSQNGIVTILVYKNYWDKSRNIYSWVFDDDSVGLYKEALVAGADTICEKLSKQVGREDVVLQFSEFAFPSHKIRVDYITGDVKTGTTYIWKTEDQVLWLCPALGKYFDHTPKSLYVDFK
jgi:hypothetical protein